MCRSLILFLLSLLAYAIPSLSAQDANPVALSGHVEGNQYVSPTGAFRVAIPVLAQLGGSITDTDNVVTFQDAVNTHQSIACFKMDATQRFEEEIHGRKEYLIWFFANFVQSDFEQRFPGARIESAHFLANTQSGTLLTYNILPGGSMFANRVPAAGLGEPPATKRGNFVFVNNGYVYVLSIELAEKVLEGSSYNKTLTEEDDMLRQRLTSLLGKITFAAPPIASALASTSPADATPPAKPAATDNATPAVTSKPAK